MTKQDVAICTTEINNANVEVGMNENMEQQKSEKNDHHSRANQMLQQMKKNVENQNFEDLNNERKQHIPVKDTYIIIHYSASKMGWDWIVLTLTLYTAIVVPMVAAFNIKPRSVTWLSIDSALDIFFFIDVGVNFHTTYIGKEGSMVTDLNSIRIKYATSWFPIDVLSCLPYDAVTLLFGELKQQSLARLLSVLKAFRLLRVIRIARDVDRYLEHTYASLIVMVTLIVLICHWMACGWYTIALVGVRKNLLAQIASDQADLQKEIDLFAIKNNFVTFENGSFEWGMMNLEFKNQDFDYYFSSPKTEIQRPQAYIPPKNWLQRMSEKNKKLFYWNKAKGELTGGPDTHKAYVACMYFTMTLVQSAGYGNIAADTTEEKIYCIFLLIIGALLYAAILGHVSNILQQVNAANNKFNDMIKSINKFADLYQVPYHLKESMIDYVSYKSAATHGISVDKVLNMLPEHKCAELCEHLHKSVIKNQPVFKNIGENATRILARNMQRFYIAPGDIVYDRGERVDSIYFVISGSLEVISDNQVITLLSANDSFGAYFWKEKITNQDRIASEVTVKALTYVNLDLIEGAKLLEVMKKYPPINYAFRRNLQLTYDMHRIFTFQTLEAVRWKRYAETDPVVAKKVKRLKKWMRLTKRNKQIALERLQEEEEEKNRNHEENLYNSTWRVLKAIFLAFVNATKYVLKINKPTNSIKTLGSNASDDSNTNEERSYQPTKNDDENLLLDSMNCVHDKPVIKRQRKMKETEYKNASCPCCNRCGKMIKRYKDTEEKSNKGNQLKTNKMKVSSKNCPAKLPKVNKNSLVKLVPITDISEINYIQNNTYLSNDRSTDGAKTVIKASCCKILTGKNGINTLTPIGEISFILEDKKWMEMHFPDQVKETLQSFLDFKLDVHQSLNEIDKNISKIEHLVNNIINVLNEENI